MSRSIEASVRCFGVHVNAVRRGIGRGFDANVAQHISPALLRRFTAVPANHGFEEFADHIGCDLLTAARVG